MNKDQLQRIRAAYDETVRGFLEGINPMSDVPGHFKRSRRFKKFLKETDPAVTGSSAPEIKDYLRPEPGMKLLDAGCCANLATKRFDKWPTVYYGIDISPILIQAMRDFASDGDIHVGGLEVAEVREIPYPNEFFDIAMVIGVFEYVDMDYAESALEELHRVLKAGAGMVLDIPNMAHPYVETMFELEKYLGRPNIPKPLDKFEIHLENLFNIVKTNNKHVMSKYFVTNK